MKHKLKLFLGGLALLCALGDLAVWAQTIVQTDLSGSEAWNCGQGPGAPTLGFCSSNLIRGGTAIVASTPTGALTAGVAPVAALLNGGNLVFGGQPGTTVTLTAMATPADGSIIGICNGTGSNFATTTIAFVANTSQTLNTSFSTTTLTAKTCSRFQFSRVQATWFEVQ